MVKEIALTRGYVSLVDDEDFDLVSQFKWFASIRRLATGSLIVYAARTMLVREAGRPGIRMYMHRLVLPNVDRIDHRDHDGLNNQRSNLRPATAAQNIANRRRIPLPKTSRFYGVYRHSRDDRWIAQAVVAGRKKHLGSFISEVEAAETYDRAVIENYGEFAQTNFPINHPDSICVCERERVA